MGTLAEQSRARTRCTHTFTMLHAGAMSGARCSQPPAECHVTTWRRFRWEGVCSQALHSTCGLWAALVHQPGSWGRHLHVCQLYQPSSASSAARLLPNAFCRRRWCFTRQWCRHPRHTAACSSSGCSSMSAARSEPRSTLLCGRAGAAASVGCSSTSSCWSNLTRNLARSKPSHCHSRRRGVAQRTPRKPSNRQGPQSSSRCVQQQQPGRVYNNRTAMKNSSSSQSSRAAGTCSAC